MDKRGFTLIELLAVIIIISLLALLTSVSVTKMVKDAKYDLSNIQIASIKAAAESWGSDNLDKLPESGECGYITLEDLKLYGLLDSKVVDPKNSKLLENDLKIKISSNTNSLDRLMTEYEVNPSDVTGCKKIKLGLTKYYSFASGQIGENLPDDSANIAPQNKLFYLRLDSEDEIKVSKAYVCFKTSSNSQEYCLNGADSSSYTSNLDVLHKAFPNYLTQCELNGDFYNCLTNDYICASIDENGNIEAGLDQGGKCSVDDVGYFECYQ